MGKIWHFPSRPSWVRSSDLRHSQDQWNGHCSPAQHHYSKSQNQFPSLCCPFERIQIEARPSEFVVDPQRFQYNQQVIYIPPWRYRYHTYLPMQNYFFWQTSITNVHARVPVFKMKPEASFIFKFWAETTFFEDYQVEKQSLAILIS